MAIIRPQGRPPTGDVGVTFLQRRLRANTNAVSVFSCINKSLPVWRAKASKSHFEHLTAGHFVQGLLGLQDRQGTIQATGVNFFVDVHHLA
jgi:hypothetical protein